MPESSQHPLYGSDRSLLSPAAAALADRGMLKWMIAVTAAVGAVLEIIDTSIVNVAMPDIQGNLGATLSEVGWISTGYACANVIMIPLTAWLSDRFGRRLYLVFSLAGFTASSVLCGMSVNLGMLIVARILQGLAGGGLLAKAQSILFETFPKNEQPAAQAVFGIAVMCGPAIGPVLGGYLTDTIGWRWIFFINLPVGILSVILTLVFYPRDRVEDKTDEPVDWTGIGLLTLGLGCFQTLLEQGEQDDWFDSRFIVWMAFGAVAGIGLFIWRELTTDHPAVDLRVLRFPTLVGGSIYSLILGMGLYGIIFAVPIFVQEYLHYTAMESGLLQLPSAIAAAFAMVAMGKIAGKVDARLLMTIGVAITVGAALYLSRINPDTGPSNISWALFFRGLGSVFMFLPLNLATLGELPRNEIASGTGFFNLTRQMGGSIGIAIVATLLSHREAIHRSVLVGHLARGQPATVERVAMAAAALGRRSADLPGAHLRALEALDRSVNAQAMLLSYADVFRYVAAAFVITVPLLLILGKGRRGAPSAAH